MSFEQEKMIVGSLPSLYPLQKFEEEAISALVSLPIDDDAISRKAAIDALNEYGNGRIVYIAVEEAVRRIEQLPPAQPDVPGINVGDMISRAKAIEALDKRFDSIPIEQTSEILMLRKDLRDLPSAQSERIRGRWIPVDGALYQCDQCGVVSLKRKFCSECGADMRER